MNNQQSSVARCRRSIVGVLSYRRIDEIELAYAWAMLRTRECLCLHFQGQKSFVSYFEQRALIR